jgi:hypothetical protein
MSASDPPRDPRGVRPAAALSAAVLAPAALLDAAPGFRPGRERHAPIHRFLNRNQQGATA